MVTGLVLSFLGASILLTIMPGPDNIFVLTESVTQGHRQGITISLGLSLGVLVHTVAAATGISIILKQSEIAFSIIKYLGALYLFYMAYKAIREKSEALNIAATGNSTGQRIYALILKGFLMNVLNPKVALFFIAFLPQFTTTSGISVTYQMLVLGLIFSVQSFVIFSAISYLSGRLTHYVSSTRFWNITRWSKVVVLASLGFLLMLSSNV
jgi:threonine/homoserine/homoserine lactone efflux protein